MANKDRNTILSHLKNLMMHIIKWGTQKEKKGNSWKRSIENSRKGIEDVQDKIPSLNDEFLKKNWDKTFEKAKKEAEKEMKEKSKIKNLTWREVFFNKYTFIGIVVLSILKLFV